MDARIEYNMPMRAKHQWGPFLWGLIHTVTVIDFEEPQVQEHFVKQAMERLKNVAAFVPCSKCATHYLEHLNQLTEEEVIQPMRLFEHMVDFHNQVNKKLNKPQISLEEAKELWVLKI
jgi:hypothetical protein